MLQVESKKHCLLFTLNGRKAMMETFNATNHKMEAEVYSKLYVDICHYIRQSSPGRIQRIQQLS